MGQHHSSFRSPSPNVVALIDVDHTLLFNNDDININLTNSLLARGIYKIYLFTDMSFSSHSIDERNTLITKLEQQGFAVRGVITPNDLTWTQMDQFETKQLHEWCFSNNNTKKEYQGKLYGEEFELFIKSHSNELPKLSKAISQYEPQNGILGIGYQEAKLEKYQKGSCSENITIKSIFAKTITDHLSEKLGYKHNKGLLLDLFIQHKPDWIESILVFDDNKQVINDISQFQMVDKDLIIPLPKITMIPVESQDMDPSYYDKMIGEHLDC
mmetsp:Transcript_11607/g.13988  ORF Transcript_11607/g.13988 Transcript_11607/m.13988 type:complete len:270 (+) Transcript_11607:61-870(+)